MDVAVIVGLIGAVCSIVFSYIAYDQGKKKQCKDEGKNTGSLMSDIGYIKAGIDDLKQEQKNAQTKHYELVERVTKVEESLKSAWYEIKKGKKVEE
jgi:peptidoglycan hydrolase CwlO-like protein